MNRIPKCRAKYFIPQQNNIKIATKESFNEHIVPKITQRNLKFNGNRNFGKDITNSIKNKVITVGDKKSNYDLQIKKHSSATQVIQKEQKLKISINEKKLRENKSGDYISKKLKLEILKKKIYIILVVPNYIIQFHLELIIFVSLPMEKLFLQGFQVRKLIKIVILLILK